MPHAVPAAYPACAATVYLAEVTDDLDGLRTKVTRSLQQRSIRVIPDTWYPRDPKAFRAAVDGGLNEADLFVQLLSSLPGRKPPDLKGGYVGFQHRRAESEVCRSFSGATPRLMCRPSSETSRTPSTAPVAWGLRSGRRYRGLLPRDRPAGRANKEEGQKNPSRDAFVFVNVNLDYDGPETAAALCRYLEQRGIGYVLPITTGQAEEVRKDLEANLLECDGMIIVYGRVSSAWVRGQLREFRKLAYRREKAARVRSRSSSGLPCRKTPSASCCPK